MAKLRKNHRTARRRKNGGGWTDGPGYIPGAAGYIIHNQYSGPGKDCPGVPLRSGYLASHSSTGALPGMAGGATRLGNTGPAIVNGKPINEMFRGAFTTGATQELAQMGGRWGAFPEQGVLNPSNGVGTIGAPFLRQPCEVGTYNALNPDPNGIQTMSTAQGYVPGWTPYAPRMAGGGQNFPEVTVGAVDSMRYYAPTAGYDNTPLRPMVPNNPGILMQVPYDAKHFNMACLKTGGRRRRRRTACRGYRNGGGVQSPVAEDAGKFEKVTVEEIEMNGVPVLPTKWGGAAMPPAASTATFVGVTAPVEAGTGPAVGEQHIATPHYVPGSSVNAVAPNRPMPLTKGGKRGRRTRRTRRTRRAQRN